ncbi:MAG: helix-turn-helix transcriptional regulator [Candidatus Sericytochromatia bacterium]|uniref:Helix-turn-helix transcriptional regulator n=1 Tax=Candidatus Tanganyikabacteria bacterium TaxID=2961651 RepID=A0A938BMC2_9BACT|nr:helix-turn-helix transcriptional regulator [Candidatus Tanganyikabacteria bacterium]
MAVVLREVLSFLASRGGAPITEVRKAFDLPSEMAAHLCIQLQDAGFVSEWELEPCHHQEGDTSCSHCSGATCSDDGGSGHHMAAVLTADDFKQGCCGMNGPLYVTSAGRAFLSAS